MRIPKYWSRQNVSQVINGKLFEITCAGWSYQDLTEAKTKAFEIAERVFRAIQEGRRKEHYLYSDRPIREEIVSEFNDGDIVAVVTRTGYGSLVLNTDSVMFIDMDNPKIPWFENFKFQLKKMFGLSANSPLKQWNQKMKEDIQGVCERNGLKIRLYSTFKGLRGVVLNKTFKAGFPESESILKELRSDYLYIRLCRAQDCFRARLTPKPFRCGYRLPRLKFPFDTREQEAEHQKWVAGYDAIIAGYSTCKYVGEFGSGASIPGIGKIIELHDKMTKTNQDLALA